MRVQFPPIAPNNLFIAEMRKLSELTIREYLEQTGLLLEADELLPQGGPLNAYYGINVSKTDYEPIDQIQGLIFAKRIQEWNATKFEEKGKFVVFIGGLYEILNAQSIQKAEELISINLKKEVQKKKLYKRLMKRLNIEGEVLITLDLWQNQEYWNILMGLIEKQVFTRGLLINDALKFYESKDQLMKTLKVKELPREFVNLPLEFIKKIGNWPAPLLYTPAEVTEAFALAQFKGIDTKIGQVQERPYDKYFKGSLNNFRIRQAVDLFSTLNKPKVVTPYIDKQDAKKELRIYFGDKPEEIKEKINLCKLENYIFTTDEKYGELLNPIVEKAIYAIECARMKGKKNVRISGEKIENGQSLINLISNGKILISNLKEALPELIFEYLIS